jgi:hypothetical protein
VAASYARLTSRGHPQCKKEHTAIDVSEYLLGREKFCKEITPGWTGTTVTNDHRQSKPDLRSEGNTKVIVSAVIEIDFVAKFEAESHRTQIRLHFHRQDTTQSSGWRPKSPK